MVEIEGSINLGKEMYVFPKDIKINSIKDIVKNYKNRLADGILVVGVDSYICKMGKGIYPILMRKIVRRDIVICGRRRDLGIIRL